MRWGVNAKLTAINAIVSFLIPVSVITVAFYTKEEKIGLLNSVAAPYLAIFAVSFVARALISYLSHFLSHKVPFLWQFHRVHHLDPEVDVTTTARFHPFEVVLVLAIGSVITMLLGLDPVALMVYDAFKAPVNVMAHANVRIPRWIDLWSRYLIVTPNLHRIHHSSSQKYTDSNFSDLIPIWDLILGTLKTVPLDRQATMVLGLDEEWNPRTLRLGYLLWPFRRGPKAVSLADVDGTASAPERANATDSV